MKRKKIIIDHIFCFILFLLPFINVNIGINVSDQGYNLANFILFPEINPTWRIATILSHMLGKLFTILPFGNYMLGMNIYCTLLLSIVCVLIYVLLKREYSKCTVFWGCVLAISLSWAPKVVLYHYLSYYLLALATILIVEGMKQEKVLYLGVAGAVLGLGLFVKFPNILEILLFVSVLYGEILYRKKIKKILLDCISCIGGYFLVVSIGIVLIELSFGRGSYLAMINNLFGMTDTATTYSPFYIVRTILEVYVENGKWFSLFLLPAFLAVVAGGLRLKKMVRYIAYVVISASCIGVLLVFWYYGKINLHYTTYSSIHTTSAVFVIFSVVVLLCVLIKPGIAKEKRLYAMTALIIIMITPVGSNNALYTNYNNLYIVAPIVLGSVPLLLKNKEYNADDKNVRRFVFDGKPLKFVTYILVGMVMFQAIMFHFFFVYGSEGVFEESEAVVENNVILTGMRTSKDNAEMLTGLNDFLVREELIGKECIVYSNAPLLYYAFQFECAIGHTWPALDSYPKDEFVEDIEDLETLPIIIYETRYYQDLFEPMSETDSKLYYIHNMLVRGEYIEIYRNSHYAVCIPKGYEL